MSVWQPVDSTNLREIARHAAMYEVFHSPSGRYWFRRRSPQESAELRILHHDPYPTLDQLDNALSVAPP